VTCGRRALILLTLLAILIVQAAHAYPDLPIPPCPPDCFTREQAGYASRPNNAKHKVKRAPRRRIRQRRAKRKNLG